MTNDDSATRALVLLTIDDHGEAGKVARLTFNNPTKRNALGVAGKQRVVDLLTSLKHNAAPVSYTHLTLPTILRV